MSTRKLRKGYIKRSIDIPLDLDEKMKAYIAKYEKDGYKRLYHKDVITEALVSFFKGVSK